VGVVSAAARRYANALLQLALEQDIAADVRDDLAAARQVLAGHAELRQALDYPALAAERRRSLARAVFAGRGKTELVPNLVALLAERGRARELTDVEDAYVKAWNEQRGVVSVEAATAGKIDAEQHAALTRAVESLTGKPVELRLSTDPSLLGGVRLSLQGRVYDGSVQARLRALRERLSGRA
jgi:F-type H+-transporting ATPase subunit delta